MDPCIVLAGCDRGPRLDDAQAVGLSNAELRHPIRFSARVETLDVEVPPDADGLSPNQDTDVYRFLKLYRREANSRLVISAPGGTRPPASIARSLQAIQRHVVDAGIDYRLTRGRRVPAMEVPTIRLAYRRPVAVPPACDKAALRVLGLSFAGWNAVASLILMAVALRGAFSKA